MIKANKSSSISVVVPVFNGGNKFKLCLDSLQDCSPSPLEVIVVADGKGDGSYKIAETLGYNLIVLENNVGPATARNTGANAALGDILLFIDADVSVENDIISRIQSTFAEDRNLSALIGSYNDKPTELNFVSQYKNLLHHFTHQNSNEEASTFWGACGAVRKSVFITNKGFDPFYKIPCIEDIEFGYRLKAEGHSIRLQKDLQITHHKRWTIISMIKTDIFQRAIPWSRLILRNKQIINDLNVSLQNRISTLIIFIFLMALLVTPFVSFPILSSVLIAVCCILLLAINRSFYLFLRKTKGNIFLLKSIPLHWLSFFYSGLAFAAVSVLQLLPGQNYFRMRYVPGCHDRR